MKLLSTSNKRKNEHGRKSINIQNSLLPNNKKQNKTKPTPLPPQKNHHKKGAALFIPNRSENINIFTIQRLGLHNWIERAAHHSRSYYSILLKDKTKMYQQSSTGLSLRKWGTVFE